MNGVDQHVEAHGLTKFHDGALPTPCFLPLPPILNWCPNQVQLQPANDCPASIYHVNATAVLIRLSLTEWQVHGVCTTRQHPFSLTLHVLLYAPLPQPIVTAFIPAVAISVPFIFNSVLYLQQHDALQPFLREQQMAIVQKQLDLRVTYGSLWMSPYQPSTTTTA
ncbi:predicted protein [Lichtheimia corymbifera JMRC:FSU:9682]|uniref:Uncharacterized protein n=1 Tax=Lichtheimia corymbifera JMRC:FSU:9682 TaxID=1263082 RepID=A0A068SF05_9FUNG|nr:predicted protein [Lichtheimia corymbifera JMRC:FSU:9682]